MRIRRYYFAIIILLLSVIKSFGQCSPDVTAPTITCPSDVIAACPHEVPSLTPTTSDFCGAIALQTYTLTGATTITSPSTGINDASSVIFLAGTTTVTYYIEDGSGNSATCNFTVTVTDFTNPIIVCQGAITATNDSGLCSAVVNMYALDVIPTAFDTCSGLLTVATGIPAGSTFPVGTTTVTWTVTDAAGNSVSCTQDVTVTDEENPTITCPTNITINTDPGQCDAVVNISDVIALDNCAIISVINDYNSGGSDASDTYPIGTTTVTFTATDSDNRTTTCSFDVTVVNIQSPTITLLGDNPYILEACSAYTELGATAVDSCFGDISSSIVIDTSALDTNAVGSYDVTYTVTNASGNSTQIIRTVTIIDTTIPTLSLIGPDPLNIGDCSTYTELGAIAIDPCFGDISGSIVVDNSTVDTSVLGDYIITYNVIDASGNVAVQITRTITVVDISGPIITLSGDNPQTIEACSVYTDLGATAIDPCFNTDYTADIVIDASGVDTSVVGSYSVTYNVVDVFGNPAIEVIRTIDVIDTTGPIITLIGDDPQIIEACTPYTELGAIAIDPCFNTDYSSDIIIDASAVDTSTIGSYNVTYNVVDAEGNVALEVIRTVTIVDTTSPMIVCPSDISVSNDSGLCSAVVSYSISASDNCPGEVITQTDVTGLTSGDAFPVGSTVLEYTVTDPLGNTSTCTFTVTVVDTELPMVVCQNISIQLDPITGLGTITPSDIDNGSSDNCSMVLSLSQTNFDCTNIGSNMVTLTATDLEGNSSTCDAQVTVTDLAEITSVSIATPITTICLNESITFTATPTNGGINPVYEWQINDITVVGETSETFTTNVLNTGDEVTVIMTSNVSICAQAVVSNTITILINEYNAPADAGSDIFNSLCTDTTVPLSGNALTGINAIGTWTVTSGQTSGFSFSDENSPTSDFTGDIGETYTLTWSIDNPEPCVDTSDDLTITFINCNALDFDGVDDNITFRDNYNLGSDFTIEVWVKSDVTNNNIQTILSKREANNLVDGYDLRLVNNVISFHWNAGESLSASPIQITTNRWYHIAVTNNNGSYKLYIDGIEVADNSGSAPIANTVDCIAGAMDQTLVAPFKPLNYFDGGLDELRIWHVALSEAQIRKMMNQEVKPENPLAVIDGFVNGAVVPLAISGLSWVDLNGYYQMNQSTDLSGGSLTSISNSVIDGVLRYMTTLQPETAPLPYQSVNNGDWSNTSTWLYGSSQAIPNSMGVDGTTKVDWNIVRSSHNISSGNNDITLLGLEVNNSTLTIENTDPTDGQGLRITDYLIIDGIDTVLKLVGESQLIQDTGSLVDYSGTGALHRDQQGTSNLYNYNYWGAPVSSDGSTYIIGDILHEGLQPVLWTTAHDANPSTTPVTMSSRWLYLYENYPVGSYADWRSINENYTVTVGLGYLMKGSGRVTPFQNYTFIGKPNNGGISTPITAGNEALVGNPYPSAIDSHEFINDNSGSILGAIYFWEHYASNTTHVLAAYQGGFAAYNLTGGTAAVSPPEVSGLGIPTKIPERYIPVGQGFNVFGNGTGGPVLFENDQRVFVKEAVTGGADTGSVFMRASQNNSYRDTPLIKRIRLTFETPELALRRLLLGFIPNGLATDGFDYGYDAINTDDLPSDMSWVIDNEAYIIQGVGDFDITKQYPLRIVLAEQGSIEIALESLQNFDTDIPVYVYDALLGTYTNINGFTYSINLESGIYNDRFYITFMPDGVLDTIAFNLETMQVLYLMDSHDIYIKTPLSIEVQDVRMLNMLGQTVATWNIQTYSQEIRLPVKHLAEGEYVIQVFTATGSTNKLVVVKQ